MRSEEEIKSEIEKLKAIAANPTLKKKPMFGDSNLDAVKAQIEILENNIDKYQIENCIEESMWEAIQWRSGKSDDLPSAGWEGLYK
jgi:hypothetical protein